MATKGFKLGKAICLVLVGFGIMFLGLGNAQATPLTVTDITYQDARSLTLPSGTNDWYTKYFLHTEEYGELTAFCVEDADVDKSAEYELIGADGINAQAVEIASAYFSGGTGWDQGDAQIAIWELVFDGNDGLNEGDVQYGDSGDKVSDILKDSYSGSASVALAISPADGSGVGPSQNYLVNVSVPDASIMFLLGPALISLGVMGRRKKK